MSRDIRIAPNHPAQEAAQRAFVDLLERAARLEGWRYGEALGSFLEAAYRAQRGAVLKMMGAVERHADNEEAYMRLVGRCREKETMGVLAQMMAKLVEGLEAAPVDFVGPIFEQVSSNGMAGQFMTPYHVAHMMAELVVDADPEALRRSGAGFVRASEPCCGVGGMVLAAAEVYRARGFDVPREVHFDLVDVDARAVHAAYAQLNLCGVSADVAHGNAMTLETWEVTPTLTAVLFPKRSRAVEARRDEWNEPPAETPPSIAGQMELPL